MISSTVDTHALFKVTPLSARKIAYRTMHKRSKSTAHTHAGGTIIYIFTSLT
jgi:hypothetical protein